MQRICSSNQSQKLKLHMSVNAYEVEWYRDRADTSWNSSIDTTPFTTYFVIIIMIRHRLSGNIWVYGLGQNLFWKHNLPNVVKYTWEDQYFNYEPI